MEIFDLITASVLIVSITIMGTLAIIMLIRFMIEAIEGSRLEMTLRNVLHVTGLVTVTVAMVMFLILFVSILTLSTLGFHIDELLNLM